jgi:superfamily II DNA or RNA helicase
MSTPLLSYQIVAASWMIMREAKGLHPQGGLLADDMGLGKTITCIATIVGHPPEKEDVEECCTATLIIADSSQAAKQWYSQIEEHGSNGKQPLTKWTQIYRRKPDPEDRKKMTRKWWERRKVV